MDYLRKYLAAPQEGQAPTGAQTVERLCDRVQSSTLLEDRRDAVRALKSLSKKFCLEVGTQAMPVLVHVLSTDRNDVEILGYALETLCNVMSIEPSDEEDELPHDLPEDLGIQFTEMFLKMPDNVSLLLSLLEEYDFHVRWPTVRLITILLANRGKDIQDNILANPMGVSRLMDLLSDSREIIRNDGLLLLIQLTRSNTNIQKIVAFENAFERLLDIIRDEGYSDGGIVVEDCLLLLLNLLKNNSSNQNFFKEGSFIQQLTPFFELEPVDKAPQGGWSAQKVTNIHLMLQLARTLVSPNSPQQQTTACQKNMHQCGLLEKLCGILMASGVPADVLTETINTVAEVIRGNPQNQEYFASVLAPSNPPRPAIVVLLMSMVNERQPFVLRCAVLYCFQSFLTKNELGQLQIVQTLLPQTAEVNTITAGQLLCGGLFSADSLSTWFAAVAMLHAIVNNTDQKEQLLRVQLATSLGNPPVSLLQQCSNILAQGGKVQTRVGLLMLISHWLDSCPIAVTHFLHNNANVPFLISQVSASEAEEYELLVQGLCAFLLGICVIYNSEDVEGFSKNDLRQIIEKRIGLEQFTDKLSQVSKHESYSRAAKKPQLNYKQPVEVIFDYSFTQLFKKLESDVLKAVSPVQDGEGEAKKSRATMDQHDSIVQQYKGLIREQDAQLNLVKSELSEWKARHGHNDKKLEEMAQQLQQLKDQNALLKAQRGGSSAAITSQADSSELSKLQDEIDIRKREIEEKNIEIEKLKSDLAAAEASKVRINSIGGDKGGEAVHDGNAAMQQITINRLNADIVDLKKKVDQKDEEVQLYKKKFEDTSKHMAEMSEKASSNCVVDASHSAMLIERNTLSARVADLESRLKAMDIENTQLKEDKATLLEKLGQSDAQNSDLEQQIKTLDREKAELEVEQEGHKEEVASMQKEQDDLLVLLADQDTKLREYKKKLKQLGEKIEDDDDEDDDDFDEDDDDDENGEKED